MPIFGTWDIVGYLGPTAVNAAVEPERYLGTRAVYGPKQVRFGDVVCDAPAFRTWMLSTSSFAQEFRAPTARLGIRSDSVVITDVSCDGDWIGPGTLVVHDGTHLFAVWNTIFFDMRKPRTSAARIPLAVVCVLLLVGGFWFLNTTGRPQLRLRLFVPYAAVTVVTCCALLWAWGAPGWSVLLVAPAMVLVAVWGTSIWMFCGTCGTSFNRWWLLHPKPDTCSVCGGALRAPWPWDMSSAV